MDPLSSPIVEALKLRPVQPVNTNLSVLLRDGLVVAGEVIDVHGGAAFLSLGGRRVAAETDVELEPGQRFLARVERDAASIVLRLLRGEGDAELPLVAALRAAMADHAPAGTLLTRLAAELRATLAQHDDSGQQLTTTERGLAAEHDAAMTSARDSAAARGSGSGALVRAREVASALLARLEAHVEAPVPDGRALERALARSGLFHEALLLRGSTGLDTAREDLKSLLLRALAELPAGSEHESVRRALSGMEAEQLLDVARSQSGDARAVSLAVPDGAAFADLQIVVDPDRHAEKDARKGARGSTSAVDVAVDFSTLGPVKAELRVEEGRLRVRFLVASSHVAERIALDAEQLAHDLGRDMDGSGERAAVLSVVLVDEDSIAPSPRPSDVRFLDEHPLVDRTA